MVAHSRSPNKSQVDQFFVNDEHIIAAHENILLKATSAHDIVKIELDALVALLGPTDEFDVLGVGKL